MPKAKVQLIAEYSRVYKKDLPKDIAELLPRETTKLEMIGMVVYAANRIQPRISKYLDYSFKTQNVLLTYYLQLETNPNVINLFKSILDEEILIFNRPANLYAITTILNSNLRFEIDNSTRSTLDYRSFLSFYLACNEVVVSVSKEHENESSSIEELSANFIATEVYNLHLNPIFTLFRGKKLIDFLCESKKYSKLFCDYVGSLGYTPISYLKEIASMYFSGHAKGNNDEFRFYFYTKETNSLFEHFSERTYPIDDDNLLEAKHIRKSPFLKISEAQYVLLDGYILIEKLCEGLIWDFLFEKILTNVPADQISKAIKDFKGEIGVFYEGYLRYLIEYSFPYYQHPYPKLFDDLKYSGKELADVFIRHEKKVLLGQLKSSTIPAASKFSKSMSVLYKEDRDKFFKIHGLDQLVESITNLFVASDHIGLNLKKGNKYIIFPMLITNENALVTALFPEIFRREFETRLKSVDKENLDIKRLQVLHISDWENLCLLFREKKLRLFRLLEEHERGDNRNFPLFTAYSHKKSGSPDFIRKEMQEILN